MKILKKIALVLLGLIVLVLLAGLFMKKDFAVERSIEIDPSIGKVYDYVKYLKNQDEFSVWMKMDPNAKKFYTGTDGTVGFISAWKSGVEDVGSGEQEIVAMIPNESIDYEMRFKEPMESTGKASFTFTSKGEDCTQVKWDFSGEMSYPFNVMLPFINLDTQLGSQLQEGLKNLKGIMEE